MQRIEAPAIAPPKGGLLAAVQVQAMDDAHMSLDGIAYRSHALGPARPVPAPGVDKTFDDLALIEGEPFWVYHGVENAVMDTSVNLSSVARTALAMGESWAVERWVETNIFASVTDITPVGGTAVNPRQAMGLLEEYAGDNYMGQPVVHVGRFGTPALVDVTEWDDDTFVGHTKQGALVANGSGYQKGAAFPEFWAYVTGQVTVRRTEIASEETVDTIKNRRIALAERAFVVTIEGPVAGVLVSNTD